MSALSWAEGQSVIVQTSLGWLTGTIYKIFPDGGVGVEIEKIARGKTNRRYLPREARQMWPFRGRYYVRVAQKDLDAQHIRPSPFTRGLPKDSPCSPTPTSPEE